MNNVIDYVSRGESGDETILFGTRGCSTDTYKVLGMLCNFTLTAGNPISLVITNIYSMMAGNAKLWKSGAGKPSGLIDPINNKAYSLMELGLNEGEAYNDDKIDITVIQNIFHMPLGKGARVGQEKGPLNIYFKKGINKRDLVTYM